MANSEGRDSERSVRASAVVASLCLRVLEEGGLRGQETLELSGGRLLEECWKIF